MEATGRYLLEFDQGVEDETYFTPDYCLIHLDQFIAPAGYAWVFPKGKNKVNIGLGVSKSGLDRRNKKFKLNDNLLDAHRQVREGQPLHQERQALDEPRRQREREGQLAGPGPEAERLHGRERLRRRGRRRVAPEAARRRRDRAVDVRERDPGQGRGAGARGERRQPGGALGLQRRVHDHPRLPDGLLRGPQAVPPDANERADRLWDEALPHPRRTSTRSGRGGTRGSTRSDAQPRSSSSGSRARWTWPRGSATPRTRARRSSTTTSSTRRRPKGFPEWRKMLDVEIDETKKRFTPRKRQRNKPRSTGGERGRGRTRSLDDEIVAALEGAQPVGGLHLRVRGVRREALHPERGEHQGGPREGAGP